MELIHKKECNLKSVFLKFIIQIVLSWCFIAAMAVLLLEAAILSGIILPANTVEHTAQNWIAELNPSETIFPNQLPAGTDYACFSKNGELLWTNLANSTLEQASFLASSETETAQYISNRTYLKVSGKTQILILSYPVRATFSSSALRRIFPSAEPFLLIIILLLYFLDLIFFIFHYAKKLEKELLLLQNASDQIRAKNLDFTCNRTHITEFNRVLDSLLLLKEELKTSLKDQWQMQQQKKEQLAALAHDIKTPLTIVKGNAQLLQETNLDAEQAEYNSFILDNSEQIQTYVTQMLAVSRTWHSDMKNQTSCHFSNLLSHIEKNTRNLCLEKHLSFVLDTADLPTSVPLSEDLLTRVLMNLIDNAIQYSPAHGTVSLQAECTGSTAKKRTLSFTVADEGCGFTSEALCHATNAFYRSDESRGDKEHFGMGLAIAKQIVTELGGTIVLANRKDKGAMVRIEIPFEE